MQNIEQKFKETEIGPIPEDWDVVQVKDIGRVVTGKTPPTGNRDYFGEKYMFVRIPDMGDSTYVRKSEMKLSQSGADYLGKAKLPKDSVMVSCIATIGKVGLTSEESFTNQQINSIIPEKDIVDPKYVYYFFKQNKEYLESLGGGGSVYTNISKSKFENLEIAFPKLSEQRSIASILSSLDDKIELNRQINANLEKIASALFKHWFVDFEFPDENGKPYKSGGGKMVDSELGEIPDGWKVESLDEVADFLNGLAMQKYPVKNQDESLPVIKIRELKNGITESTERASKDVPTNYIVGDGDVLFSWSGSLEVEIWAGGLGALNQHLFKVTSNKYPKWFYYQWIKWFLPNFQAIAAGKAVTMGHIKREHLSQSFVLVPRKIDLSSMDDLMSPLLDQIAVASLQTRKLMEIRDSLLPRLMSGKIRTV